ncbi:uncharacterized protein itprid2 isoform X2 [Festucalex cinctus]
MLATADVAIATMESPAILLDPVPPPDGSAGPNCSLASLRRLAWAKSRESTWQGTQKAQTYGSPQSPPHEPPPESSESNGDPKTTSEKPGLAPNKITCWLDQCRTPLAVSLDDQSVPASRGAAKNGCSFEDDLSLGAEADHLQSIHKKTGPCSSLAADQKRSQYKEKGRSMNSTGSGKSSTVSSVSELLDLYEEDPEEILLNLGFGRDEPDMSSKIPSRFFNSSSAARGIDIKVYLGAQLQRMEVENPNYALTSRFRQIEVLTTVANQFIQLYGHVSGQPVQNVGSGGSDQGGGGGGGEVAKEQLSAPSSLFQRNKSAQNVADRLKKSLSKHNLLTASSGTSGRPADKAPPDPALALPDGHDGDADKHVRKKDSCSLATVTEEGGGGGEGDKEQHLGSEKDGSQNGGGSEPESADPAAANRSADDTRAPEKALAPPLLAQLRTETADSFDMEEIQSNEDEALLSRTSKSSADLLRTVSQQSDSSGFAEETSSSSVDAANLKVQESSDSCDSETTVTSHPSQDVATPVALNQPAFDLPDARAEESSAACEDDASSQEREEHQKHENSEPVPQYKAHQLPKNLAAAEEGPPLPEEEKAFRDDAQKDPPPSEVSPSVPQPSNPPDLKPPSSNPLLSNAPTLEPLSSDPPPSNPATLEPLSLDPPPSDPQPSDPPSSNPPLDPLSLDPTPSDPQPSNPPNLKPPSSNPPLERQSLDLPLSDPHPSDPQPSNPPNLKPASSNPPPSNAPTLQPLSSDPPPFNPPPSNPASLEPPSLDPPPSNPQPSDPPSSNLPSRSPSSDRLPSDHSVGLQMDHPYRLPACDSPVLSALSRVKQRLGDSSGPRLSRRRHRGGLPMQRSSSLPSSLLSPSRVVSSVTVQLGPGRVFCSQPRYAFRYIQEPDADPEATDSPARTSALAMEDPSKSGAPPKAAPRPPMRSSRSLRCASPPTEWPWISQSVPDLSSTQELFGHYRQGGTPVPAPDIVFSPSLSSRPETPMSAPPVNPSLLYPTPPHPYTSLPNLLQPYPNNFMFNPPHLATPSHYASLWNLPTGTTPMHHYHMAYHSVPHSPPYLGYHGYDPSPFPPLAPDHVTHRGGAPPGPAFLPGRGPHPAHNLAPSSHPGPHLGPYPSPHLAPSSHPGPHLGPYPGPNLAPSSHLGPHLGPYPGPNLAPSSHLGPHLGPYLGVGPGPYLGPHLAHNPHPGLGSALGPGYGPHLGLGPGSGQVLSTTEMQLRRVLHDIRGTVHSLNQSADTSSDAVPEASCRQALEQLRQKRRSLSEFRAQMSELELAVVRQQALVYKHLSPADRLEVEQLECLRSAVRDELLELEQQLEDKLMDLTMQHACKDVGGDEASASSALRAVQPVSELLREQFLLQSELSYDQPATAAASSPATVPGPCRPAVYRASINITPAPPPRPQRQQNQDRDGAEEEPPEEEGLDAGGSDCLRRLIAEMGESMTQEVLNELLVAPGANHV